MAILLCFFRVLDSMFSRTLRFGGKQRIKPFYGSKSIDIWHRGGSYEKRLLQNAREVQIAELTQREFV